MIGMTAHVPERIDRMRGRLAELRLEGLLLFDMRNIRYLTGFTGSEGACLLRGDGSGVLLVDGRYLTQARVQVQGIEVEHCREKIAGLAALLAAGTLQEVGFEAAAVTFDLYTRLKKEVPGQKLKPVVDAVEGLRMYKDEAELALLSRAVDCSHRALNDVLALLRPGVTEREIAVELEHRMKVLGAEDPSFPTIVAAGARSALPHARPGSRKLHQGDTVIIDYGATVEGYRSDETCTFIIGPATEEIRLGYEVVKEAHDRAIAAIRPGVTCREVDRQARGFIEEQGWGDHFPHGTGHGVGLDVHELPRLSPASDAVLQTGMVVTVEPGVYLPGRWGIRIEDMVLVEDKGGRELTKTSKEYRSILH